MSNARELNLEQQRLLAYLKAKGCAGTLGEYTEQNNAFAVLAQEALEDLINKNFVKVNNGSSEPDIWVDTLQVTDEGSEWMYAGFPILDIQVVKQDILKFINGSCCCATIEEFHNNNSHLPRSLVENAVRELRKSRCLIFGCRNPNIWKSTVALTVTGVNMIK